MTSDLDRNHWAQGFKSNPIAIINGAHTTLCRMHGCSHWSSRRSPCAERAERAKLAVDDKEGSA